jgi:hypothetical protein
LRVGGEGWQGKKQRTEGHKLASSPQRQISHDAFLPLLSINQHWRQEVVDVKTMMNTWTLQKGFPLITITVSGRNVHMKQEHYMKGSERFPETG